MRFLLPALVAAGVLLPAAALSTTLRPVPPGTVSVAAGTLTSGVVDKADIAAPGTLLVAAANGLRLSRDDGKGWVKMAGSLPLGTFSAIVADPRHRGVAYATNGDVYRTATGGRQWARLPSPTMGVGPAGVTALACDPASGRLYAAGTTVLSWDGHTWSPWGFGWPAGAHPAALLASPGHGLYAVAGNMLFHLTDGGARWARVATWTDSIDALALGPDGTTPFIAVHDQGIWWVTGASKHHVDGDGLRDTDDVYVMRSDPVGKDLYVAAASGLLRRHQPADSTSADWQTVLATSPASGHIVALQPWDHGRGMLALSQDGSRYEGRPTSTGQSLAWSGKQALTGITAPLVAALSGAEWQPAPSLPRLPAAFSGQKACTPFGPVPDQTYDVCGPFRTFYVHFGGYSLFGYPVSQAQPTGSSGGAVQDFAKARLEWTGGEVRLAPLGKLLAQQLGHHKFPGPTAAQVNEAYRDGSIYFNGYTIDPRFYPFWHTHLDPTTGVSIFGPPISQSFREKTRDGTGATVWVQYFRNARLEYVPGSGVRLSYVKYGA